MMMTLPSAKVCFALLLLALVSCSGCSAQAENGSTQAVMSLTVLPNGSNVFPSQPLSHQRTTPAHPADTLTSQLEQTGTVIRRVWVVI